MTAKAAAWIAAAALLVAGAGGAGWYVTTRTGGTDDEAGADKAGPTAGAEENDRTLNTAGPKTLVLQVVSYSGLPTLQPGADAANKPTDLETIFRPYKLHVRIERPAARSYPFPSDRYLTRNDLDSLSSEPQANGEDWKVTAFMLGKGRSAADRGLLLRETTGRNQFAVFTAASASPGRILRTTAHELGHALNLFHSDADAAEPCCAATGVGNGRSLMNQERCLDGSAWLLELSQTEGAHLLKHPMSHVEPGTPVPFGICPGIPLQAHKRRC